MDTRAQFFVKGFLGRACDDFRDREVGSLGEVSVQQRRGDPDLIGDRDGALVLS